jgi:hypothetical protein
MSQIRLSRTEEIDTVLSYFRKQYPLLSESEIIKIVLSEKYREKQYTESIIDLESHPNMNDVQEQIRTPRPISCLLSMTGVLKGERDVSSNKKKYTY